ncbi:MAG: AMP-binding protein, partial [Pseudomonadota bacterium]
MHDTPTFPVLDNNLYQQWYAQSITDPGAFWGEQAERFLQWDRPWTNIATGEFAQGTVRWFEGGQLNVSVNCLDRHIPTRANKTALLWVAEDGREERYTYQQLLDAVVEMASTLRALGIKAGDRVGIYLPMIPMAAISMLACARIGAVHTTIFSGFSAEALCTRLRDAQCSLLITCDEANRAGKVVPLKVIADEAIQKVPE